MRKFFSLTLLLAVFTETLMAFEEIVVLEKKKEENKNLYSSQ